MATKKLIISQKEYIPDIETFKSEQVINQSKCRFIGKSDTGVTIKLQIFGPKEVMANEFSGFPFGVNQEFELIISTSQTTLTSHLVKAAKINDKKKATSLDSFNGSSDNDENDEINDEELGKELDEIDN